MNGLRDLNSTISIIVLYRCSFEAYAIIDTILANTYYTISLYDVINLLKVSIK